MFEWFDDSNPSIDVPIVETSDDEVLLQYAMRKRRMANKPLFATATQDQNEVILFCLYNPRKKKLIKHSFFRDQMKSLWLKFRKK